MSRENELNLIEEKSFEYPQLYNVLHNYRNYLYGDNAVAALCGRVERFTLIDRTWIAFSFIGLFLWYLLLGNGSSVLCSVIGASYPVYASVKVIEKGNLQSGETKRWLRYWIAYSVLNILDSLVLLSWLPSFFFLKFLMLIWCMLPVSWNGSEMFYMYLVKPFFLEYQLRIDRTLTEITDRIVEVKNNNIEISDGETEENASDNTDSNQRRCTDVVSIYLDYFIRRRNVRKSRKCN